MRFSIAFIAASAAIAHGAVFSTQSYNDLSISDGVAGNALAEAQAKLGGLGSDLTAVDQADIDFLGSVNSIANDAETEAFNPAIDDADGDAADALERGKVKNKVLKLLAQVMRLQIEQAQGDDNQDDLDAEQAKLDKDVALDEDEAGNASTAVDFDAETD